MAKDIENGNINEQFSHNPVMLKECIKALNIKPGGFYVDCTGGGGGHSFEIAKRLENGHLLTVDQDGDAVKVLRERLSVFGGLVTVVKSNFVNTADFLSGQAVDGVLIDLGVSSYQLDNAERGFSYTKDSPLDMRMDASIPFSAYDVVNGYAENELKRILYEYGEEKFAPRIASAIIYAREKKKIETTAELSSIIKNAIPAAARSGGHHPAKRSFQAVRIEVNKELDVIEPAIRSLCEKMNKDGRFAVITFHSLEDRIVKRTFADLYNPCSCPPSFPVCICGKKPQLKRIKEDLLLPSDEEIGMNPRSRSAKLRIAEHI